MDKLVSWSAGKGGHFHLCLIAKHIFKSFFFLKHIIIIFFILKNLFLISIHQNNLTTRIQEKNSRFLKTLFLTGKKILLQDREKLVA
jgi:hypothetical protein